ncbi:MAG: MATE family efflux transporter [Brevinema sp.]
MKEILDTDCIFPLLLKLSIPVIIGGVSSALYNMVDSIFIGRYVGSTALAGLTISHSIQLIFIAFSAMFSVGAGTLISRFLGAKQYHKVAGIVVTASWAVLIVTVVISIIFLWFLKPILSAIGAVDSVLPEALTYTKVVLFFAFVVPLNGIFSGMLRAKGLSNLVMYLALLGSLLNIILDILLIIYIPLGVFGAALATVLAQIVVCLCSIYYINKIYKVFPFNQISLTNNGTIFLQISMIGMPSGIKLSMVALTTLSANKALELYGVEALAAYGIVSRVISLAFMPMQGCNFAIQPIISFNYGAQRLDRIKKTLGYSVLIMLFIGSLGSLGFIYMPLFFFQLFTSDFGIIYLAKEALAYAGIFFILFGVYMLLSGFMQSVGSIKEAWFLALSRPTLNIFLFFIFPQFFGIKGIWLVIPTTDIVNAILAVVITYYVYQKVIDKHQQSQLEKNI